MESLQKMMNMVSTILDIDQNLNGELYLEKFIKNIAINLNIKYVLIGHPTDNTLQEIKTDVVWANDKIIENFTYTLKNTPCEIVLSGERVCIHEANVSTDFPNDLLLQEMKIESYVGAPVVSKNNTSILVLLDDKPMQNKEFFSIITEFLAQRAAAEIEKIQHKEKLKYEIEKRNQEITLAKQYEIIYKDNKELLEYITIENDLQSTLDKIVFLAEKRNLNIKCSILLLDDSKSCLLNGSAPSLPEFYNEAIHGIEIGEKVGSCGSAAFRKERVIVENIDTHENWQAYLELTQKANLHACWSEPIISSGNKVLGTFAIYNHEPKKPSTFELKLIESYANLASKAIEKDNHTKELIRNKKKLLEKQIMSQNLSKSQEVLLSLFDKGESILFKWKNTENWPVEYVSKGTNKILGYDVASFLNNEVSYSKCIHQDDLVQVQEEVKQAVIKNLDYFKHEPYRIITKNGDEKWVLDHTATQKDNDNNITHFIGYITDITEQIKSQEMMFHQSKIASLGEMLGNIAHQWRQPLSLISTAATGAKVKKEYGLLKDEEFYRNMDSINDTAQYLSQTIDDFRNFFLADTSGESEVNIENVIEKVLSLIKDSYKSSNIEIIKNYKETPLLITCNENLLIQAFINIFNNAKDALNSIKTIDKKLVFINLEKRNGRILIEIQDNANGIPKDVIHKIFDPYFTTKHKEQGTGIGLYMTNQIITKHLKSKISVENIQYHYLDKEYSGALFKIIINKK